MKKILVCFVGTGTYLEFLPQYYEKVMENFCPGYPKDILVLTDGELSDTPEHIILKETEHKAWPYITLERFNIILKQRDVIEKYDWFVFMDADTIVNQRVEYEEFFDESKDYLGVHHPCHYLGWPPHNQPYGSFDRTNSRARVGDDDDLSTYWQGCLWGGKVPEIFAIMEELDSRTQLDLKDDIIALWHDESHLNKIFIENKDKVRTLPSDYAYPECFDDRVKDQLEPKIVHLAKNNSKYHS